MPCFSLWGSAIQKKKNKLRKIKLKKTKDNT